MDVNRGAAIGFEGEASGFDERIDNGPLASPVVADLCMTVGAAVFHQIGPVHIVVLEAEYALDLAGVEVLICGNQEIVCSLHRFSYEEIGSSV